jgi:hypothetical protein
LGGDGGGDPRHSSGIAASGPWRAMTRARNLADFVSPPRPLPPPPRTAFLACRSLESADFGDLSTFFTAIVDAEDFEEPDEFLRAIGADRRPDAPRYV